MGRKKGNEVAGGGSAGDLAFTRTSARVGFHQDGETKGGKVGGRQRGDSEEKFGGKQSPLNRQYETLPQWISKRIRSQNGSPATRARVHGD